MISIVAMKKNTATILHTSPHASIEIASREVPHNTLTLVADILTTAGIATRVLESEAEVIWRKFSRLAPLAAVTAALQKDLGHVREEDAAFLGELVRESAEAAEVAGAPITKESIISDIESLPAEVTTSLQRDVAAGHPTECDAIIGAIVRLLEQHHISHDAFDRANQLIQGGLS
jgi:2-dehydropantoate 2-reductase